MLTILVSGVLFGAGVASLVGLVVKAVLEHGDDKAELRRMRGR